MAMLQHLESEGHSLAVCKIRLDAPPIGESRHTTVVFELSIGAEPLGSLAIPAAELGVPLNPPEAQKRQRSDDGYRISDSLIDFIRHVLPSNEPLYLVFDNPSGYLPGVPWEKLMTAQIERPVLRLGAVPVQPVRSNRTLHIACCCSPPGDSESRWQAVRQFIQSLPRDLPRQTRFHIFADIEIYPRVLGETAAFGNVQVYDPAVTAHYASEELASTNSPEANQLENPWLLWIRDSLKQLSVDGVHFLTSGELGRTRPAIIFARPPLGGDDYAWLPMVGSRHLAGFLEQVGAWAVCFSSSPGDLSLLGLRMFFDEIAHMVTGPAALHDMAGDPSGEALQQLYRYMFAPEQASLPRSPALALATHPGWIATVNTQPTSRLEQLINEYSLSNRVPELKGEIDAPAWVTAQQRSIEKTIGKLAAAPQTGAAKNREQGVLDALKFTSDLVAKYSKLGGRTGGNGGGDLL